MNWPGAGRRAERAEAEASATVVADETRERARRIGDILRQSRVDRGITLADVEQDIRINRLYIEALENARFEELPAPVYARGFMRSYARHLGLDPEEAALAIPRDLPRPVGLEPSAGLRRTPPMSLPTIAITRPIALGLAAVAVVLLLAVLIVPRLTGRSSSATATATPTAGASAGAEAPNVVGLTREQAQQTLQRAGLTPLVFESANAAPAGQVFRQSPPVGFAVKQGDVVTLFVSQGPGTASGPTGTPSPTATPTPTPTPTATPSRTPTPTATPAR